MTIPSYLPYFFAAGTVAVLITIFYGLNRALADAHWPASERMRTLRVLHLASLAKLRRETGASERRGRVADVGHP
jgi:hypothetical protein